MLKPEQSRAARGLLGWTQQDLAEASGVHKNLILKFERGGADILATSLEVINQAFERAEIEFPDSVSVRKKTDHVELLKGEDALKRLWQDILNTLKSDGGEVLITNVDEKRTENIEKKALHDHLNALKENNITERLLSCVDDTYFLMPQECYRWISKELFTFGTSTYVYKDKVAMQLWQSSMIILVHSREAYMAEKARFEDLWSRAMLPPTKIVNNP
ncbi:MAG: XRE family transcriptional regulator [Micavibrio aeruginosavorus]|uniref:XRE family transcriptional regulator n=1 Tax=Micavibrio aeruginosavorus TaxID=349221 RepID=A0A2W5MWT1_9BACT|nr:MAG: XRE family transcriptional regulator [Micavibrio aeruginosavorus]